ncbi:DUF6518 family protein [Nocardioides sp. S-58]|uniref:DUF6518 family protein n=1 Tax=Nocardioides renjunii TaxID=3095075 RepID=A0ABU5KFJ8_9ACTN|nr:DUF6518 family protein [Nocardioides sp. S-58]MDZ5663608.1 DUF6518 family protein [Nocardioides sp. S-58]
MVDLRRTSVITAAVVGTSLLLGGLTSWAQGVLPDALAPFANSPSGWTLLTVLVVATARPSLGAGAALGVASFVSLVLGYTAASELRGLSYDPVLWGVVGVVAGPVVGAAAAAVVDRRPVVAAVGAGVLAGVLVADGIYGLTVVGGSTSPVYWTLCLVAGCALVGTTAVRLRSPAAAAGVVASAAAATGVLTVGYGVLNRCPEAVPRLMGQESGRSQA